MTILTKNIDEASKCVFKEVLEFGSETAPRGMKIKELISYNIAIESGKNQIIQSKGRKLNYAFQLMEKMSFVSGKEIPDILCVYNTKYGKYKNEETGRYDGDYSVRISGDRHPLTNLNQLEWVYDTLKKDRDSRQAVITIRDQRDQRPTKDHPCTLSLQFFIRDNKLHLITTMRSNDAFISFFGYDTMNFTFIQNVLAAWLEIEVGTYYHNVGSMHIYESHFESAEHFVNNEVGTIKIAEKYNNTWNACYLQSITLFNKFWVAEEDIRNGRSFNKTGNELLDQNLEYLEGWWERRRKRDANR
jgi:thymidylate synthase